MQDKWEMDSSILAEKSSLAANYSEEEGKSDVTGLHNAARRIRTLIRLIY
jgi:hypothetical protein